MLHRSLLLQPAQARALPRHHAGHRARWSILTGVFERVREFTRKPYIIYGYMYAHGIRVDDVPLLNKEGILKHAVFVPDTVRTITDENRLEAGHYLYRTECKVCHTLNGINPIVDRVRGMSEDAIFARIGALNSPATPWMPPFVGTDEERRALAHFLFAQTQTTDAGRGLQTVALRASRRSIVMFKFIPQ